MALGSAKMNLQRKFQYDIIANDPEITECIIKIYETILHLDRYSENKFGAKKEGSAYHFSKTASQLLRDMSSRIYQSKDENDPEMVNLWENRTH